MLHIDFSDKRKIFLSHLPNIYLPKKSVVTLKYFHFDADYDTETKTDAALHIDWQILFRLNNS